MSRETASRRMERRPWEEPAKKHEIHAKGDHILQEMQVECMAQACPML